MPLLHPIIFWMAVGGVSIPIAIHLLNRRRFRVVDWAAMRFLMAALKKNRRRLRLEELLLLALRCLIILLLGLALARFVGCDRSAGGLLGGNEPGQTVFLLDDTPSMGQARGEGSDFRAATVDLSERLMELPSDERIAILRRSNDPAQPFVPPGQITDRPALAERLSAQSPSDRTRPLAAALQSAGGLFAPQGGKRTLLLLGDFRRVELDDSQDRSAIAAAMAELQRDNVRVVLMDYGRQPQANLTLQELRQASRFALASRPVQLEAVVVNNGPRRAENVSLKLAVTFHDGRTTRQLRLPEQVIASIDPGESLVVPISLTPPGAGDMGVSATLPADDLPGDNTATTVLSIRPAIRVLLVDGKADSPRPEQTATYFLRMALDPGGEGVHGFAVETITRDDLADARFGDYDIVFLANLSAFPATPVETPAGQVEPYGSLGRLEAWVAGGGAVVIYTGDRVDTTFYNGRFFNRGAGLLPLPVRPPAGDPQDRADSIRLLGPSIRPGGAMDFFAGPASAAARLIRFFAWTPMDDQAPAVTGPHARPPVIEATFDNPARSPAVVSKAFGRGKVVAFASTASLAWNDWALDTFGPVRGLYVLYLADLVERIARPQRTERTARTGRAISYSLPADDRDAEIVLYPPGAGAEPITLPAVVEDGRSRVRLGETDRAGLYRLRLTRPTGEVRDVYFARNIDPREGQLTPADPARVESLFEGATWVNRRDAAASPAARVPVRTATSTVLLGVVLVLLAAESLLARRFGHWTS